MELKILEERPNPLLKRIEYRFEIDHAAAATPTRESVRVELAKVVKTPKDRVIIEKMNARFGTARSIGFAAAYQSTAAVNAVVREHILIRNGLKEKAVKAVPGAAAPEAPPPPKKEAAVEAPAKTEPSPEPPAKKESAAEKPAKKEATGEKPAKKEPSADKPVKKEASEPKKGS